MVNTDLLKKHAQQYKLGKDTAGEYHRQLFKLHPELAEAYDAEDIDPDAVLKSQKFIMYGMAELQYFFRLPDALGDDRKWRTALSSFKEQYGDVGFPLDKFNKTIDAFLAAMEKNAGGVTSEQKKNWEELLNKAYADMKTWGWY
uniref:Globin family profile domain-containing protein n=1 Tax=Panagrolaimus sp. ES5 TaxID=591445 RepID=A0AC34G1A3_9BILA